MNDDLNQQILVELRRLRRSSNIGIVICVLLVVGVAVYLPLRHRLLPAPPQPRQAQEESWDTVRKAMDHFEYDHAFRVAQRIVERYPNEYYGYAYLGNIALATGRPKEAQTYYLRAYEILPSEEHEKMLKAIALRIESDLSKQATAPK